MNEKIKLAEEIKNQMVNKNITIDALSKATNITVVELQAICSGKRTPQLPTLKKIADGLGCSFECLYDKLN